MTSARPHSRIVWDRTGPVDLRTDGGGPWSRSRRGVIALLFAGNLIMWGQRLDMGVAAPALMAQFHWTLAVVGAVLSACSVGYVIAQGPGGVLSDALPGHAVLWAVVASSRGQPSRPWPPRRTS